DTSIVDTGYFAGNGEFTTSPVTHDLHAGLVVDHEVGRVVPGAVGRTFIGELLEALHDLDGLGNFWAAGHFKVAILVDGFMASFTKLGEHHDANSAADLPGFTTDSERRDAGFL